MFRQFFCLILMLALPLGAQAANKMYRFKVDGRIVIVDSVPADLAPLGYEVLNSKGMVIQTVPRELTPAEIAERDRRIAAEKAREKRIREQKDADQALMRLYATPADAERALKRKSDDIQSHIDLQERRLGEMQEKLQKAQKQAAGIERQGRDVGPELRADIAQLNAGIEGARQKIAQREQEKAQLQQEFDAVLQRLEFLQTYPPGTLPDEVSE